MKSLASRCTTIRPRRAGASGQRGQRGASVAEFVIVSPFALLIVLALIQLGLMFVAKQIVNEAAFLAARTGAVQNAQIDPMRQTLVKALTPFYQDSTDTNDFWRLFSAWFSAKADLLIPGRLEIRILNPRCDQSDCSAFQDFGLTDPNSHRTYIPNDSLEYRDHRVTGPRSGLSIQDANTLKIRVAYAYPLKVPLMRTVFRVVMCGGPGSGVNAFGRGGWLFSGVASVQDCIQYYEQGRVPIVSYATVQMQTPAWPPG